MITIDFRSRKPLYQQLVDNIEDLAARGLLPTDSQLPSVRALAVDLSINPNTIQRAYMELEKRGVIYSLPGRGSFVGGSAANLINAKQQRVKSQLGEVIRQGLSLELSIEDMLETCKQAALAAAQTPLLHFNGDTPLEQKTGEGSDGA